MVFSYINIPESICVSIYQLNRRWVNYTTKLTSRKWAALIKRIISFLIYYCSAPNSCVVSVTKLKTSFKFSTPTARHYIMDTVSRECMYHFWLTVKTSSSVVMGRIHTYIPPELFFRVICMISKEIIPLSIDSIFTYQIIYFPRTQNHNYAIENKGIGWTNQFY